MPQSHQAAATVLSLRVREKTVLSLLLQLLVLALRFVTCSPRTPPPPAYYSPASTGDVISYSFTALDDDGLAVTTRSFSSLSPASFLFDALIYPAFNRSQGFVLLSQPVQLWGADDDTDHAQLIREASFNTSFTVHGVSTVAFVILLDSFPALAAAHPSGSPTGNSSTFDRSSAMRNASNSLAAVEVGAVTSYSIESPDVGLNVTVMLNRTASGSTTVWIEYNAVAHHLWVYAAAAGEPKPLQAILDASLVLTSRHVTQNAFVGFFAAKVRDAIHGIRNWELIVDRFPGSCGDVEDSRMAAPWLLILLVVLGSVAAMACVVSTVVCFRVWRRRQDLKMEHIMKQSNPRPSRRTVGMQNR